MGLPEDPIGADAVHLPLTTGLSDLRSQLSTPVNGVVRQSIEKNHFAECSVELEEHAHSQLFDMKI